MPEQTQQHSAQIAAQAAGLTAQELWLHYFSVGGNLRAFELEAYLHDAYPLPIGERNLIALALNEMIDALPPRPKAAFDDELALPEPLQNHLSQSASPAARRPMVNHTTLSG